MDEGQAEGMEEKPAVPQALFGGAVPRVADHRVADGRHVHPDLMCSSAL